jgi:hypothetical protein
VPPIVQPPKVNPVFARVPSFGRVFAPVPVMLLGADPLSEPYPSKVIVKVAAPAIQFKVRVTVCFCAARPAGID